MEKALKETINELVVELANVRFQKNIAIQKAAEVTQRLSTAEAQVAALNKALETEKSLRESAIAPI